MDDLTFIQNETDYENYKKQKPFYKYERKNVKFICTNCHTETIKSFRSLKIPFLCTNCQCQISANSEARKNKYKQTSNEKYGTDNPSKASSVKEKRKNTNIAKYGLQNVFQVETIKNKIKRTCNNKYGVDNPAESNYVKEKTINHNLNIYGVSSYTKTDECKNKIKNTCKKKYGVSSYTKTDECKNKIKNTCMERYNTDSYTKTSECKNKIKNTCMDRYNTDSYMKTDEFKLKSKNTNINKYGVESYSQTDEFLIKTKTTNNIKYNCDNYSQTDEFKRRVKETTRQHTLQKAQAINTDVINLIDNNFIIHCPDCKNIFSLYKSLYYNRVMSKTKLCTICNPVNSGISSSELSLRNYIKNIYKGPIIENDRITLNGKELDIYLPVLNLAFEFDGLYWHNELYKPNNYHLNKTIECEKHGIQLIHIFENEWNYKQDIVKSRINGLLRLNNRIYARKCIVKEVPYEDSKIFLDKNHIQGNCISTYRYGLYYNNNLVAIMTFGKNRFNNNEFELLRFCNILNTNIIGGASKLFKYFINTHNINKIISYADRRWSIGNLYETIGFTKIGITHPSYYYINRDQLINRLNFRKSILVKEGYDPAKSEHEIMLNRKIYRIYDCGNIKYEWIKSST